MNPDLMYLYNMTKLASKELNDLHKKITQSYKKKNKTQKKRKGKKNKTQKKRV